MWPSLPSSAVTAPLQGASCLSSSFPFLRFQGFCAPGVSERPRSRACLQIVLLRQMRMLSVLLFWSMSWHPSLQMTAAGQKVIQPPFTQSPLSVYCRSPFTESQKKSSMSFTDIWCRFMTLKASFQSAFHGNTEGITLLAERYCSHTQICTSSTAAWRICLIFNLSVLSTSWGSSSLAMRPLFCSHALLTSGRAE